METTKDIQMVGFRVGAEMFGVPIMNIHEIVRVPDITAVPEARNGVEGVINLRGRVIPVIDLRKLFRTSQAPSSSPSSRKNRILVAEIDGKFVGLIVDAASEVLKLPASDLEPPP